MAVGADYGFDIVPIRKRCEIRIGIGEGSASFVFAYDFKERMIYRLAIARQSIMHDG